MNILIVRVSSLGDIVHNMPMVADILHQYPHANIDWVVEEGYVSLARLNQGVRRIIPFALRRWRKSLFSRATRLEMREFLRQLRMQAYDLVFDSQGLLKTGVLMGLANTVQGGKKVGLANGTEGSGYEGISRLFHTLSVPVPAQTHAVLRGRLLINAALGVPADTSADFMLSTPNVVPVPDWLPQQAYAAFFHGTARAAKQWPRENWIAAGRTVAEYGLPILMAWGNQDERNTAEQLAREIPGAVVLPKLSMMDAVLFAQRTALAIGVDTGLTHIAAAYCRPTIELYCDSPRWKTEGTWSPQIINLGDTGSPPTIDEVQRAIAQLMGPTNLLQTRRRVNPA